jgi:hypothetical protein
MLRELMPAEKGAAPLPNFKPYFMFLLRQQLGVFIAAVGLINVGVSSCFRQQI